MSWAVTHEDRLVRAATPRRELHRTDPLAVMGLLALQRGAGNRATAAWVAKSGRLPVQRCGSEKHAGCPCAEEPAEDIHTPPVQRLASGALRPDKIVVSRQTDDEIVAAGAEQPAWRGSSHAFNLLLHQQFPAEEKRLYSGSRADAAGSAVTADIAAGTSGRVMFAVGPGYGAATTLATLPSQIAELRKVLVQVMLWRLSTNILSQEDLAFTEVSAALRATDPLVLRKLQIAPGVDQGARDTIKQLLDISTPVGAAANLQPDGSATETAGGVVVRLLRDQRAGSDNHTSLAFEPATFAVPGTTFRNGRITSILGPSPTAPEVRIQTTYASAGSQSTLDPATASSGYGAGTTPPGSLRLHEGTHGSVFVQYFRDHPYRPFAGVVGMTTKAWEAEARAYVRAYNSWAAGANTASLCKVDCVGNPTIDKFHAGQAGYVNVCTPCSTP